MRSRLPVATLAGAVVLVLAAVAIGAWMGRSTTGDVGASSPSPAATITAAASPAPPSPAPSSPAPSATPSPTQPAPPSATPIAPATCDPADLAARITSWEGAAGSRIATVELGNIGSAACELEALARPQLVDGANAVLINGKNPTTTNKLTVAPGDVLTTLVSAANYCQAAPQPPVTVAFVLSSGERILAAPASQSDATVPDCLGPGQPGQIEMHPWS